MKNWIALPRIEGKSSRQAHADLPEGTYVRFYPLVRWGCWTPPPP